MANPQIEEGYTKIANEIIDALISTEISGQDFRIAMLIIRKTYGFNKCEDAVSLSQMMTATGMGKIRCSQVVTRLQLMKILTVTENINGIGKKYKFNKDFDKWDTTVKENINRLGKVNGTVNVLRNIPLRKTVTTKDNITKDRGSRTLRKPPQSDDEWMEGLINNQIYKGINVKVLYGKLLVWCENNGKKPTRRRFVNWLNREDRPLQATNYQQKGMRI